MEHGAAEHIEHAEHAAHAAGDDYTKTVTISIAIVAAVLAAIAMLGHNLKEGMLSAQIAAGINNNEKSNAWAEYQAYNIRSHAYQMTLEFAETVPIVSGAEEKRAKELKRWDGQVSKYETQNMPKAKEKAEAYQKEADRLMLESQKMHHRAERLDLGELGLQLGVVLSSLAILTKRRGYWYAGLLCAGLGFACALTGYFDLFMGSHATEVGHTSTH